MSSESIFSCNFLDFKTERNPNLEMYEDYFLDYDSSKWKSGSGGGSFKFFDGEGLEYSLTISEDSRYGIILSYEKWDDKNNKSIGTWYSVGQDSKLSHMVQNEDELEMPLGSYIKPENAWLAVKEFLREPEKIPGSIKWVDVEKIPWPED